MQTIEQTQVERVSVEDEYFSPDIQPALEVEGAERLHDSLRDIQPALEVEGAERLHDSLREIADEFDVTGFKCVKCGLVHKHDTTKHRLSDTFDVSDEDVASLDYSSVCHCGIQEAGRHGSDIEIDEGRAASIAGNAPIPPEAAREMNAKFGSL